MHVQRKCHNSSAHLLASPPESPVTTTTPEPHHFFLNQNFVPVTLPPGILVCPHTGALNLFTTFKDGC